MKPGDYILMERNAAYFKDGFKGDPKISKIKFRTIKDGNTRTAELMTGAIDWLWDVPKDQAERIKANPAIVVENAKTLRVSYLQFDVQGASGQKFFTDKRVRQAVAHAIDREAITKNLVGPGLGRRPRRLPSRPVRLLERRAEVRLRSGQGQGAAEGGRLRRRLRVRHLSPIASASTPRP